MGSIYKITNIINNKLYIGKTIAPIATRWSQHICEAMNQDCKGYSFILHKAIRKYGKENFHIEEIEKVEHDMLLDIREKYWINALETMIPNGYNMTFGGEGSIKIDRDQVYFLWNQGLSPSEIAKRLGCSNTSVRAILSNNNTYTVQEGLNRSLTKGLPPRNDKVVYQYNKDTGELVATFSSIKLAAESAGVDRSCISRVCSGKRKTSAGYIWKFILLKPEEVLNG